MTPMSAAAAHVQPPAIDEGDKPVGSRPALRIGGAARRLGVSASVLRLWERQGLVRPARSKAGYRLYSEDDLAVLSRVRRMRSVDGVNAPGIRQLLEGTRQAARADESSSRGERLRRLRLEAGLSLRRAATRAGLSASYLSALERGSVGASVATLQRVTSAYGATLQDLFSSTPRGRLVRPDQRPVLELDEGSVRIEQLAHAGGQLEPHLFVLAPGASSEGAYSHPGEEFIYVLDGKVRIVLAADESYDLAPGDALTFASTIDHRWHNLADKPARLLWINTPPTF